MAREFLDLAFLFRRSDGMGVELHGMRYPLEMPFGLFSALPQQHLAQRAARNHGEDNLTVECFGSLLERGPSSRLVPLGGLKLKNRLTGYFHSCRQLLGGHSERLAEGSYPTIRRRLERRKLSHFFEPFVQLSQLNNAKSFCHIVLGVHVRTDRSVQNDERKNNLSHPRVNDNKILAFYGAMSRSYRVPQQAVSWS